MFERLVKRAGISRDQLRLANVVWQRPPNNWLEGASWEAEAVETWRPALDSLIDGMKPKVIFTMGNVALKRFTELGGKDAGISRVRGFPIYSVDYHCWVLPTYHPSFLVQGQQKLCGVFIYDLQRALEVARQGFTRVAPDYVTHPTYEDALAFQRGYDPVQHTLSYDIETPFSSDLDEEDAEEEDVSYDIIRISFSYAERQAISLPWQPPFIDIAREMLGSAGRKRVWNASFDNPRLAATACPVRGMVVDSMWAWKHLQPTLPRNLQFAASFYTDLEPWKHLARSEPERYSATDADALHRIGEGVDAHLRKVNLYDTWQRHGVELMNDVLEPMARIGMPVDDERRLAFRAELQDKLATRYDALQAAVPAELRKVEPSEGYKSDVIAEKQRATKVLALGERWERRVFTVTAKAAPLFEGVEPDVDPTWQVERWCRVQPFLPSSSDQVLAYIKYRKHPVPKPRKRKQSDETSDREALERLYRRTKDEVYHLVLECRRLSKVIGTFVDGWAPGEDGRIHPTPGFWGNMYRISWRKPNVSATIKDKDEEEIAAGFRKCVAPVAGRTLIEADWSGIEAVLVGWFADDAIYRRLAGLGVHSFFTSHILGRPMDVSWRDDQLRAAFKEIKRNEPKVYDDAKHCVHGTNYGMGPRLMAEQYGMTEKRAKELQALYFSLFPKIKRWQDSVVQRAYESACLTNPFNYRMPFWDVMHWDSTKRCMVRGDEAKSAISFLPRDTAAGMLKEVLLRPRMKALVHQGIIINCTHDSILADAPDARVPEVARTLKEEMEAPQLGGLSIGVEVKVGKSWHEDSMQTYEVT